MPTKSTCILIHTVEEIRLTTWDVKIPVNNATNYLSTGAGFLPSTVFPFFWRLVKLKCFFPPRKMRMVWLKFSSQFGSCKLRCKWQQSGRVEWAFRWPKQLFVVKMLGWVNFHPGPKPKRVMLSNIFLIFTPKNLGNDWPIWRTPRAYLSEMGGES